jgi:hypothetical protein
VYRVCPGVPDTHLPFNDRHCDPGRTVVVGSRCPTLCASPGYVKANVALRPVAEAEDRSLILLRIPTNIRVRPLELIVDGENTPQRPRSLSHGDAMDEHHFREGTLVESLPECGLALLAVNVVTPGTRMMPQRARGLAMRLCPDSRRKSGVNPLQEFVDIDEAGY